MTTNLPIGFIGVGAIGLPMALRLATHTDVVAVEPFETARRAAEDEGLAVVAAVADLPDLSHAIVMVATPDQVRQVVLTDQLASKVAPGGCIVVMSTVGISTMRDLAEALRDVDVSVVDAPVTGGVTGARAGVLRMYVAGPARAVETVHPHLLSFGEPMLLGEDVGSGQAAKLVNNVLVTAHLVVAAEAIAFAESLGLDTGVVLPGLLTGAARSWSLAEFGPEMIREIPTQTRALLRIFMKDADLIEAEARRRGARTPVMDAVHSVLQQAAALNLGELDSSQVIQAYRAPHPDPTTSPSNDGETS